jgi:hypothetical protein
MYVLPALRLRLPAIRVACHAVSRDTRNPGRGDPQSARTRQPRVEGYAR